MSNPEDNLIPVFDLYLKLYRVNDYLIWQFEIVKEKPPDDDSEIIFFVFT